MSIVVECYSTPFMAVTRDDVLQALSRVKYPGFTRDLVAFDVVPRS